MAVDRYSLYNLRLYSDSAVATERAVVISQGTIEEIVSDTAAIVGLSNCRNLGGAILSPGLLDLCCRIDQTSVSLLEKVGATRRSSLNSAVTDIALIATPRVALSLLRDIGFEALNQGGGACVVGIRIDCCADSRDMIRDLTDVLTHFATNIIDVRCLSTVDSCESIASTVHELGGRLCLEIPDRQQDNNVLSRLLDGPITCVSVDIKSLERIPEVSEWLEVRMPSPLEIDVTPNIDQRLQLPGKLLVGNHRLPQSTGSQTPWSRLRREMYYATEGDVEFMPLNNAVLYMNRHWGVPMNRLLTTATYNAAQYIGRGHVLGRIGPSYLAHLSILDRKLVALDAIV
jgi:hypothetical protein